MIRNLMNFAFAMVIVLVFMVGALALTMPAAAAAQSVYPPGTDLPVFQPSDWRPTIGAERVAAGKSAYYSVAMVGMASDYHGALRPYAITAPSPGTIRFELRDGDQHPWDIGVGHNVERVELATRELFALTGQASLLNYVFTLEAGRPNTARWLVLGQLRQDVNSIAASPPFELYLNGEMLGAHVRWTDSAGKVQMREAMTPMRIERGRRYRIAIGSLFHPIGGHLYVDIDGVRVARYAGPMGYAGMRGVNLALGIYREGAATETIAARYGAIGRLVAPVTFP